MAWIERSSTTSWRVRYRREDGTIGAINGFATKKAATDHANTLESDQRAGTWIDPDSGKITVREWSEAWLGAIDVAPATDDYYRSMLRSHVLPEWGEVGLADISGIKVASWAKLLSRRYKPITVTGAIKLLSLLLADAVEERLIVANPVRIRRRGRHTRTPREERLWATCEEVLAIADNAARLPAAGPGRRPAHHHRRMDRRPLGRTHRPTTPQPHTRPRTPENRHRPEERVAARNQPRPPPRPTQTAESARDITLPPFRAELLRRHVAGHSHRHVFISLDGNLHRRSNFGRRTMRPAADGNHDRPLADVHVDAVKPGLVFHGLRHSHKHG